MQFIVKYSVAILEKAEKNKKLIQLPLFGLVGTKQTDNPVITYIHTDVISKTKKKHNERCILYRISLCCECSYINDKSYSKSRYVQNYTGFFK